LRMRGTVFEFHFWLYHQGCTHSISYNSTSETSLFLHLSARSPTDTTVCVLCPCISKNTHILIAYKYNVRPQGCQAREHRCRQLLQLVAVERQSAVAKQKAEKIISTRKQNSTHIHKVSDVHQNNLC
jgi:hypothetical protein